MLEPSQFCYHYGITARNTPYSACLELGHDTKSYTGWLAGEGYWVEQADELKEADSTGTVRHLAIVPVLIRRATSVFTIPVGNAASERTFNYLGAFLTPHRANVSPAFLAAYLTFCCEKKVWLLLRQKSMVESCRGKTRRKVPSDPMPVLLLYQQVVVVMDEW